MHPLLERQKYIKYCFLCPHFLPCDCHHLGESMRTKYVTLYEKTLLEKQQLDQISKIVSKEEKYWLNKQREKLRAILKEIEQVQRELAS